MKIKNKGICFKFITEYFNLNPKFGSDKLYRMPQILESVSLKGLNTFGVEASARWFTEVNSEEDLFELFSDDQWKQAKRLIIGGGSNILFTQDFDGLVVRINIKGIRHEVKGTEVFVTAGAGEVWKDFVLYCVNNGFAGVENLSLIPGTVGASPVQNIGAYGVELKDVFYSCDVFNIESEKKQIFFKDDCGFGYRDSIFKKELKGKVIISSVCFKLSALPSVNTSYGAISHELTKRGIINPGIKEISEVVSEIRINKLPDPSTIGNAGSFFKNPVVTVEEFRQLQSVFPDIVHYCLPNSTIKIAAGWLIEQCGWKGKSIDDAGTWKNQSLVLVNYGNATGSDIYKLSTRIIADVEHRFGIALEREVNIV